MSQLILTILVILLEIAECEEEVCTQVPTPRYSCPRQQGWGKCSENWIIKNNYCAYSCGRCKASCGLEGACAYGTCNTVVCANKSCSAERSFIEGEILVLDYNSFTFNSGPNHPAEVTNPAACCAKCKKTEGCNAWSFCSHEDGCGDGCDKYVRTLPKGLTPTELDIPTKRFGQFGGCHEGGNKWPWLMCSLKKVEKDGNIQPLEVDSNEGWISGLLERPTQCSEDVPQQVCFDCDDNLDCLDCASETTSERQTLCPSCTNNINQSYIQQECIACLLDEEQPMYSLPLRGEQESGCWQCATLSENVQECFECSAQVDALSAENGCYNCFRLVSEKKMECRDDCVLNSEVPSFAKPECFACYNGMDDDGKDPARCVQCLKDSQDNETYCGECNNGDCYNCLAQHPGDELGRRGCANCGKLAKDDYTFKCYQCVNNDAIPDIAKAGCRECSRKSSDMDFKVEFTPSDREACYDCLKYVNSEGAAYSCGLCNRPSDLQRSHDCYDCVASRPNNGGSCSFCSLLDNPEREACYNCNGNPEVSDELSEYCHLCFGEEVENWKDCVQCIVSSSSFEDMQTCF